MKMNRVQFQPGISMAEFMDRCGSDDKCEAALIDSRWPVGFSCPAGAAAAGKATRFVAKTGVLPVHRLPPPVQPHQRHALRGEQAKAFALVHCLASADRVQEQRRGARTDAPYGGVPQDRLAREAQAHGCDAHA